MADSGGGKETGIAGAIRQRHEAIERAMAEEGAVPAQLPLLPLREDGSAVDEATDPSDGEVSRGPGRPPGARNRRTQEWVDYILSKYPSPLEALASTYARPVEALAKELNCSRADAYKIQQQAAVNLAPYIHQKQPMAMQIEGKGMVQLIIQGVDDAEDIPAVNDDSLVIEGTVEPGPEGEGP